MSRESLQSDIMALKEAALKEIEQSDSAEHIELLRIQYLGRKGSLTTVLRQLKSLSDDEKRDIGSLANTVKDELQIAIDNRQKEITARSYESIGETEWTDITQPGLSNKSGSLHPLTQTREDVEDAFINLGFTVIETPELESEYYNFEALNIPSHHPARDMQDTFWLENGTVMRTHTSSAQVRMLEQYGAPLRIVQPGRCFRYEASDASHDSTFYQVEGLMVDTGITAAHMVAVIKSVLGSIFRKSVEVRLRPGFFPFVEPGMELDLQCLLCNGKGCRVCKHTGWLEFMGCGMVHPSVLRAGNVDPAHHQGFAFGFGLSRLTMMRYGITDVRYLLSGDLRFLRQF